MVRRASWRLTFIVWSTLLATWALLTVTLGRRSLLVIERLVGDRTGLAIAVVAVLVGLPLLIDAARNVPHYRGAWRRRSAGGTWRADVPEPTPRRFRFAGGSRWLTWRERSVVRHGQLAFGTIARHGALCSVVYRTPWGGEIASVPAEPAGAPPREGSAAPLLFEPGASTGVAPTLVGLEFLSSAAQDMRSEIEAARAASAREQARVPLLATLHPFERGSARNEVGELRLEQGRLTLAPRKADAITVRLDRPVRVELGTWLRDDGTAEIDVLVEPAAESAYRAAQHAPLRFKTELGQARIDRRVACRRVDACYVDAAGFDLLWPAIVAASGEAAPHLRSLLR